MSCSLNQNDSGFRRHNQILSYALTAVRHITVCQTHGYLDGGKASINIIKNEEKAVDKNQPAKH